MNSRGKKRMILCCVLTGLALISAVTAAAISIPGPEPEADFAAVPAMSVSANQVKTEPEPKQEGFVVKSWEGFIAVYSSTYSEAPAMITEIETCTLRDGDRELLEEGIYVQTHQELMALLEDFGS